MQQRQLRLGDILDDYCPRERRVTNHAVVAMIGSEVKQTRCTTCDSDHEYKHAKVPRQRKKADGIASLHPHAVPPKRAAEPVVASKPETPQSLSDLLEAKNAEAERAEAPGAYDRTGDSVTAGGDEHDDDVEVDEVDEVEEGPVHRPLIRATLPRPEGQAPPARPAPEFTIRQPGGRPGRFRPRHQRGGQPFGGRSAGGTGGYGSQGSRGPQGQRGPRGPQGGPSSHPPRHQGRKRSK
jgi:hypothetical protein